MSEHYCALMCAVISASSFLLLPKIKLGNNPTPRFFWIIYNNFFNDLHSWFQKDFNLHQSHNTFTCSGTKTKSLWGRSWSTDVILRIMLLQGNGEQFQGSCHVMSESGELLGSMKIIGRDAQGWKEVNVFRYDWSLLLKFCQQSAGFPTDPGITWQDHTGGRKLSPCSSPSADNRAAAFTPDP